MCTYKATQLKVDSSLLLSG
ncbi:rCG22191 [Rattus norvegicus]|uniref:RCG22191 n=1 Tax=Rattus norvegicus TaxID=10116 RepID=A6IP27_RAT|nr:rCG22191 [Rattus norvegicus]